MKIIQIVLNNEVFDKIFDYLLPDFMNVELGSRVIISIKNKEYIGIVINIKNSTNIPKSKLKYLKEILDNESLFSPEIWKFANKISTYYQYSIGAILFQILPIYLREKIYSKYILDNLYWVLNKKFLKNNFKKIKSLKQKTALSILKKIKINYEKISFYGLTNSIMISLQKKNLCFIEKKYNLLPIFKKQNYLNNSSIFIKYNNIINKFFNKINIFVTWIISGSLVFLENINLYLNIINIILYKKKQILILVPKIYDSIYIYKFLKKNLNVSIYLLNSKTSNKENFFIWKNIRNGTIPIIIGTHHSILTSFLNLGLIIVSEEHDITYKQLNKCKYNIRNIAILRAKIENIPIILDSATPSLETLNNINIGKYTFLSDKHLNTLYNKYYYFNLIKINKKKFTDSISDMLLKVIKRHLDYKNNILLCINNLGRINTILCNECYYIPKCSICNNNYIFYIKKKRLCCSFCKNTILIVKYCLNCKSIHISIIEVEIAQIIRFLNKKFPTTVIVYMNEYNIFKYKDKLTNKSVIIINTSFFIQKKYDILRTTLIAFINVDYIFFTKNFRYTEYFFQYFFRILKNNLEMHKKKEIIIETNFTQHDFFNKLINYPKYYYLAKFLLKERKLMLLPPFSNHVILIAESYNIDYILIFLNTLKDIFIQKYINDQDFFIIGPINLLENKQIIFFRKQIILQHLSKNKLYFIIKNITHVAKKIIYFNKIKFSIDIDPIEY
ncbi:replication restart helicase PriA [Enterobacteriaceae endosymbiont of Plateumaris braccata]|uniref:replication restart helicase PriA n=1 Tax=Enterobacteriaceae endosymbiont of Plateumaris braccata TaxID=2675793 RepID=UPI0014493637|nr:primosomal protein N' [Enterobacteriaceae endosymbiont of Plateumaris braccata]QJC28347.1 primosomal protein N' [Enterobacteriaceae endosymbiont of Plateumaris braccata]